jgi:hypothetical protein
VKEQMEDRVRRKRDGQRQERERADVQHPRRTHGRDGHDDPARDEGAPGPQEGVLDGIDGHTRRPHGPEHDDAAEVLSGLVAQREHVRFRPAAYDQQRDGPEEAAGECGEECGRLLTHPDAGARHHERHEQKREGQDEALRSNTDGYRRNPGACQQQGCRTAGIAPEDDTHQERLRGHHYRQAGKVAEGSSGIEPEER